ncbi:MAG: hypothetical protein JXM70_01465 [Pirellulales bacterium]|nr:hypothetical protein [Pirellulales bacterium]
MSRIHAHRLISANGIREQLLPIGNILPANESQTRALAGVPEEDRQAVWERVVEEAPVNATGRPAITAKMIEETAEAVAWDKLSPGQKELRIHEEEIRKYAQGLDGALRGMSHRGGIDTGSKPDDESENFPRTKEEYFEKRDNEEWERQWQNKSEQEAHEEKERDEQRSKARPYLNIRIEAHSLKDTIREYLRSKIVYRFREEKSFWPVSRKGSWPPQFAEVAIEVLEGITREIKADPDNWIGDPPTHPWQRDDDDCELDCKWDEIDYEESTPEEIASPRGRKRKNSSAIEVKT